MLSWLMRLQWGRCFPHRFLLAFPGPESNPFFFFYAFLLVHFPRFGRGSLQSAVCACGWHMHRRRRAAPLPREPPSYQNLTASCLRSRLSLSLCLSFAFSFLKKENKIFDQQAGRFCLTDGHHVCLCLALPDWFSLQRVARMLTLDFLPSRTHARRQVKTPPQWHSLYFIPLWHNQHPESAASNPTGRIGCHRSPPPLLLLDAVDPGDVFRGLFFSGLLRAGINLPPPARCWWVVWGSFPCARLLHGGQYLQSGSPCAGSQPGVSPCNPPPRLHPRLPRLICNQPGISLLPAKLIFRRLQVQRATAERWFAPPVGHLYLAFQGHLNRNVIYSEQ